jgi:DNA-binding NarL/FixJ family response regulator
LPSKRPRVFDRRRPHKVANLPGNLLEKGSEVRRALERARVLLADDQDFVLDLVEDLLKEHFEVVGKVNDGRAMIREAHRLQPDVIISDITMPILGGIEAARELRESGSTAKVVFLTAHHESELVARCLAEGALGYVTKSRTAADLIPAIREALSSRNFVSPFFYPEVMDET